MTEVKVGIGVAILRDFYTGPKILLGKRKGSHGSGEWALPGGKMEHMESFDDCALREIAEEVGPDFHVEDLRVVTVTNLREYAPKHYLDIGMTAMWVSGDPVVMEPDKCEAWEWFDINDMPTPRFATVDRTAWASIADHYMQFGTAAIFNSGKVVS